MKDKTIPEILTYHLEVVPKLIVENYDFKTEDAIQHFTQSQIYQMLEEPELQI